MLHSAVSLIARRRGVAAFGLVAVALVLLMGAVAPAAKVEAAVVTFEAEMLGSHEVPAASSPANGYARFTFNDATGELTYAVWVRGVSSNQVTASHIHRAPVGTAGPPVYTLATGPFDSISGSIMLTTEDIADLRAGNLYVNFHTTSNPPGAARAQLVLPSAAPAPISPPSTGDGGLLVTGSGLGALGILAAASFMAAALGLAVRGGKRV